MAAAVRMSRCSSSTASASTATWSARSPPKCRLLMNSVIASEAKQSRAVTAYSGLPRPPEQIRGLRHDGAGLPPDANAFRSEEHTSELQSLMRISYAVFCLKKKKQDNTNTRSTTQNQINTNFKH